MSQHQPPQGGQQQPPLPNPGTVPPRSGPPVPQQPPRAAQPPTTSGTPPRPAAAAPAPHDDKLDEERREAWRIASYGAQVILDYDGDAALGARGGAAGDIVGNQVIRDADLVELGHDPVSPSNDRLATRPNWMPGKGPEPKRRWVSRAGDGKDDDGEKSGAARAAEARGGR